MPRTPKTGEQLQRKIMDMAQSPLGLTWRRVRDAATHDDRIRARNAFNDLVQRRALHQRTDGRHSWWFASAALAAAWVPPPPPNRPPQRKTGPRIGATAAARAAGVVVTVCPGWSHDPRYQVAPGARAPALFAALPMGSYLDE